MKRIFQVGFNKCGSTSLHLFFTNNNIRSVHWDEGHLSRKIYENIALSQSAITGYEEVQAFTDMVEENDLFEKEVAVNLLSELYSEFPDSIYVFNDRHPDDWVRSRLKHENGHYAKRAKSRLGVTTIMEVKETWLRHYHEHKNRVITFFGDSPNFVHLDIDDKYSLTGLLRF